MVSENHGLLIPEGGQQTPHQTAHSSTARLAWPDLQGVGLGLGGFLFVFLEDFCCLGLQPEPWCTVLYDLPSAACGEAGAEIREKWVGEEGRKEVVRRGQG